VSAALTVHLPVMLPIDRETIYFDDVIVYFLAAQNPAFTGRLKTIPGILLCLSQFTC
jgi:hypothetical protein